MNNKQTDITGKSLHSVDKACEVKEANLLEAMRHPQRDLASSTGVKACELNRCSLVDLDKPWDAICFDSFPRLIDIEELQESDSFVLRPFWIPDDQLIYQISSYTPLSTNVSDAKEFWQDVDITRQLLKCSSPEYIWKDVAQVLIRNENSWLNLGRKTTYVFCFNQIEQSLKIKSISDTKNAALDIMPSAPQIRAMWSLPFIFPFGLVSIGHSWKVGTSESYIRYQVEGCRVASGMRLVMIRREGQLRPIIPNMSPERNTERLPLCAVSGLTVFSLNHGIVMEDRMLLRATQEPGLETRTVLRLRGTAPKGAVADETKIE